MPRDGKRERPTSSWPETYENDSSAPVRWQYDADLERPFLNTKFSVSVMRRDPYWKYVEDSLVLYLDGVNQFHTVKSIRLFHEDPFSERRVRYASQPRRRNTTACFREVVELLDSQYHDDIIITQNKLISVYKMPDEGSSVRVWGYLEKEMDSSSGDTLSLLFTPILFDPYHLCWPLDDMYPCHQSMCLKLCSNPSSIC